MPCKIALNGPANVSSYFLPRQTEGPFRARFDTAGLGRMGWVGWLVGAMTVPVGGVLLQMARTWLAFVANS